MDDEDATRLALLLGRVRALVRTIDRYRDYKRRKTKQKIKKLRKDNSFDVRFIDRLTPNTPDLA